jgi:hypothetical protein
MDRSTHSTTRPKHLEQNLNRFDTATHKKKPTSASQKKATQPTLRNITENNRKIIYPSIQLQENKNTIIRHDDDSSIVESSSGSDEEVNSGIKSSTSEITLCSRPSSVQKKNGVEPSEGRSIHYFEYMPEDVIRKILFEHFIDLNNIPTTAKNLMHFASISKFNRQFVRDLLTEEGLHEVSYEITKSVMPDLLSTIANDKKAKFTNSSMSALLNSLGSEKIENYAKSAVPDLLALIALFVKDKKEKFTQADIDSLVHDWPYLTIDCSYKKDQFSDRGLEVLRDILIHPGLQGVRIINNLPENDKNWNPDHHACNYYGLELLHTLLSRRSSRPLKADFFFNNWMPPLENKYQLKDKSINKFLLNDNSSDLIDEIQDRSGECNSVIFGEIDLSRSRKAFSYALLFGRDQCTVIQDDYRFNFAKMMCKIALQHSAHTISIAGFVFDDRQVDLILNEIQKFDKKTLQHLDLNDNQIGHSAANKLSVWLQSEDIILKTLKLDGLSCKSKVFTILENAIKKNHSLELVEIMNVSDLPADHPILKDKRVRITKYSYSKLV